MRPRCTKCKGFRIIHHAKYACQPEPGLLVFTSQYQMDKPKWRIAMHIPPVHNGCALVFVIGGF
jgi:hypothetical protein